MSRKIRRHFTDEFKQQIVDLHNTFNDNIDLDELETFLRKYSETASTEYRKLLSVYDLKRYNY